MNTLIIGYFVIGLVLICIFMLTDIIPLGLWVKEAALAVLLICLAIGMMFVPTHMQKANVIGNAVLAASFEDADLYYDMDSDFYFAVEMDRWNPFEMYKRIEIPQELAQKKILEEK